MRLPLAILFLAACSPPSPLERPSLRVILHEDGVENAYPRISDSGREVLYQSNRGGHWHLYVLDLTTGASRAITSGAHDNNLPDWSPDGSQIAFVSNREGDEEVYIMNADGSALRRLTHSPGRDLHPYFNPDGRSLVFNSYRDGNFDVFAITLADGTERRLTQTPQDETCARYAPDGRTLVLLRNDAHADDVWVVDATGAERNVTQTPKVRDGWPVIDHEGRWIYFAGMEGGSYSLYRVRVDGSARERLTTAAMDEEDARPSVSRDGTRVIFNRRHPGYIDIVELYRS